MRSSPPASRPGPTSGVRPRELLAAGSAALVPLAEVRPVLGFTVADYVDFYASEHHATNAGRIFRPDGAALAPNWKHLPVGYHGRAGTVVASGTPIPRPARHADARRSGRRARLDFEAEVGFVVGAGRGRRSPVRDADEHVFGVCLLNDWSARDMQALRDLPLGPFLGKSFATSVSPWVTPLAALGRPPAAGGAGPGPGLPAAPTPAGTAWTIELDCGLNGTVLSPPRLRPPVLVVRADAWPT